MERASFICTAKAAGRADWALDALAKARRIEEADLVQIGRQPLEDLQRNQVASDAADRLTLNVAQRARAIEQLNPLELQGGDLEDRVADAELVPDHVVDAVGVLGSGGQVGS